MWDAYVRAHAKGTVFHLCAWKRIIERSFKHRQEYLMARDPATGNIAGVMPLFLVNSLLFGRLLVSTPVAAYGGILADSAVAREALLAEAQRRARELKVKYLEIRSPNVELQVPGLPAKDLYVTFRQELFADPEKNYLAIPRKTRAEIREGLRNNLDFREDAIGSDEFFSVYSRSVRELGTPVFPKELFANGLEEFSPDCKIFSVHLENKPVAAVWTLLYKDEVVPYFGGSLREYNRLAVNNFMYWMLIKWGCEHGFRIYDFGRSKKGTGSFSFKKRWGMQMSDLPYQYSMVQKGEIPDTSPLNPKYALAINVWRRLPLWFTNSVGPSIARHLI
jgi:FemAB-related protein (PEP-CTERM system-associated)